MLRGQLADAIVEILNASSHTLTAKDILARLRMNGSVTQSDINSVLYRELSTAGLVQKDESFRWAFIGTQTSHKSDNAVRSDATLGSHEGVGGNNSRQNDRSTVVQSASPPISLVLPAEEFASIE